MSQSALGTGLRNLVRATDAVLRRIGGVFEFEDDSEGLLRIAVRHARHTAVLRDGTRIERGAPVVELHFWNEHLPPFPPAHTEFGWAPRVERQIQSSLCRLAEYMRTHPEFANALALRIRLSVARHGAPSVLARLLVDAGFEPVERLATGPETETLLHFIEGLWAWLLTWTYNPRALIGWRFDRTACEYWISRRRLSALCEDRKIGS